ncbi:MAG: hypothetical protein EBS05_22605 [Proteobacteria bacterium]|nr:hypothetical protein [Pseudomonadota bacterium]
MNTDRKNCPECGTQSLFQSTTNAGGGYGPVLLPGLGKMAFWGKVQTVMPQFRVVVCAACGLTRFYAEAAACARLPEADNWQRI